MIEAFRYPIYVIMVSVKDEKSLLDKATCDLMLSYVKKDGDNYAPILFFLGKKFFQLTDIDRTAVVDAAVKRVPIIDLESFSKEQLSQLLEGPEHTAVVGAMMERSTSDDLVFFLKEHLSQLTGPERTAIVGAIVERGTICDLESFSKEQLSQLLEGPERTAVVGAMVERGTSYDLEIFLKEHLSQLKGLDRIAIVSAIVKKAGSGIQFLHMDYLFGLTDEEFFMVIEKMTPDEIFWLLEGHFSELTLRKFRILIEGSELPVIVRCLQNHLLTKEQALAILPFLDKHRSQLPDRLFEHVAKRGGPLGIVLFSRGEWQQRRWRVLGLEGDREDDL
jgi:hypothetical protein